MFNFFNTNRNTNLEWIGVDIHSHLLPGIDDGSPDIETSVKYVRQLYDLGLSQFICTPHIFKELYPNSAATIKPALDLLSGEIVKSKLPVKVSAAAEYMIDSDFDAYISQGNIMCLPANHLLIEMSYIAENSMIDDYIFNLQIRSYKPILAHPERYIFYHNKPERYRKLKELGCLFQLNLLSLTGYYGNEIKQIAIKLIKEELIDFVGTDLHHDKHLLAISEFVKSGKAWKQFGNYPFKNKDFFYVRDKDFNLA